MDPNRPYPEGVAFDEAWYQCQRADKAEAATKNAVNLLRKNQWCQGVGPARRCPECDGLRPGDTFQVSDYFEKGTGHSPWCALADAIGYWESDDPDGWFTDRPAPAGKPVQVKWLDGSIRLATAIYHPRKADPLPCFCASNGELMLLDLSPKNRVFTAWREV